jgi:hypothetical protein
MHAAVDGVAMPPDVWLICLPPLTMRPAAFPPHAYEYFLQYRMDEAMIADILDTCEREKVTLAPRIHAHTRRTCVEETTRVASFRDLCTGWGFPTNWGCPRCPSESGRENSHLRCLM